MSGHCPQYPTQPDLQDVPKFLSNHGPFRGSEHPESPPNIPPWRHAPNEPVRPIPRVFHPHAERISHPQDDIPASTPAPIAFHPTALSAPSPHPAGMTACSRRLSEERATPPECRTQPTSTYPIAPPLPRHHRNAAPNPHPFTPSPRAPATPPDDAWPREC